MTTCWGWVMSELDQWLGQFVRGALSESVLVARIAAAGRSAAEVEQACMAAAVSEAERLKILQRCFAPDQDFTVVAGAGDHDRTQLADDVQDQTRVVSESGAVPIDQSHDATLVLNDDATLLADPAPTKPLGLRSSVDAPQSGGTVGIGSVLKERFVLEELIGHGGMGSVFRARDLRREEAEDAQTDVAIKLVNEDFKRHPDAMVALQREAKKAQTLAHPNIVTVYDFDREGDTIFLSMAYLRGMPLDDQIARNGAAGSPQREALTIIAQMASGLAYAHEKLITHADFKPGNVFVCEDGSVRILDFGIARAATLSAESGEAATTREHTRFDPTNLGAITPNYASAEMLEGKVPIPSDDIYALGCVAYEVLTGRHPYRDEHGRKLTALEAERRKLVPPPLNGSLPKRYRKALVRAVAIRREHRFANAREFQQALAVPAKVRASILAAVVVLGTVAAFSWLKLYEQSDMAVNVSDLPPALSLSVDLMKEGDAYLSQEDHAQAHRFFAQAWEEGRTLDAISPRDRGRLKVLLDRRVDQVTRHFIAQVRQPEADVFSLEVLQLTLEALHQSELGTLDSELDAARVQLDARLTSLP